MLTARQKQLLSAIIEEFSNTAQAVGSLNISDKYDLDISPATIRNEMARLSELGFLDKTHSSAGRVPTSMAIKLFIDELLEEYDEVDSIMSAVIREEIFQRRFNQDKLITQAVSSLHKLTANTSLAIIADRRYIAGLSSVVGQPEYRDMLRLKRILLILEDYASLAQVFQRSTGSGKVKVLVGEETGLDEFTNSAIVFATIHLHGASEGYLAVVGPNRMKYSQVIPAIRYISETISEAVSGWDN